MSLFADAVMLTRRTFLGSAALGSGQFLSTISGAHQAMKHAGLLGDSTLDNAAYVVAGADITSQLGQLLPNMWKVDLLARDGAVISDVVAQLTRLPAGCTHLVISVGGNDALRESGVFEQRVGSVAEALQGMDEVREKFRASYVEMLEAALSHNLPTAVCTIYNPRYPDRLRRRIAAAGLALLNDVITREAFGRRLSLIDLRIVCDHDADFANPIEPSAQGGAKIARAILNWIEAKSDVGVVIE